MTTFRQAVNNGLRRSTGYILTKAEGASTAGKGMNHASKSLNADQLARLARRLDKSVARLERVTSGKAQQKKRDAPRIPADFDEEMKATIGLVRPYTKTSYDKLHALITAVRHIERVAIPGAVVECGVWRGGSMHAVARTLAARGNLDRELFLFDTFTGMTTPTERDVTLAGESAAELMRQGSESVWAIASLEDVRAGFRQVPYPSERVHYVIGEVEKTVPGQAPEQIALLRLDTDWYESTRHELEHLYPRLLPGGVLIIDDYGSWQGSKEAADEFLESLGNPPLMWRAGRARVGIKPAD